ncbi:hypothetical protein MTO96_009772 [Rhipicephalus appendiculatus]
MTKNKKSMRASTFRRSEERQGRIRNSVVKTEATRPPLLQPEEPYLLRAGNGTPARGTPHLLGKPRRRSYAHRGRMRWTRSRYQSGTRLLSPAARSTRAPPHERNAAPAAAVRFRTRTLCVHTEFTKGTGDEQHACWGGE